MTDKERDMRLSLAMKKISYLISPIMYDKFEKDVEEFIKSGKKQISTFFKNEF